MERYYSELLPSSESLKAYDAALNLAWKDFYALIAPDSKKIVLDWYRNYRKERQKELLPYIGNPKAFTLLQEREVLPIHFMRGIIKATKQPDGRLQRLLKVIAAKDDARAVLYALYSVIAAQPDRETALRHYEEEKDLQCVWTEGSDGIELCTEAQVRFGYTYRDTDASLVKEIALPHWGRQTTRHEMEQAGSATFYGRTLHGYPPDSGEVHPFAFYLTRVQGGLISFLSFSSLPAEKDFFKSGEVIWPGQPEEVDDDTPGTCYMDQSFEFAADRKSLTLRLVPSDNREFGYTPCVSQCYIPYALEGNVYMRKPAVCLPDGEWGYRPHE